MAIVPKRKTSKARRNKRRANWRLKLPTIRICTHCGAYHRSHGNHRGEAVLRLFAFLSW